MKLVKILTDEDGDKIDKPVWCYVIQTDGSPRTFCGGQVFGFGEGYATFELKEVAKGGITCENCLHLIKTIKAIKL